MSLDLTRIKALCFDVDGTLSDTDDLYAQRVAQYLPRFLFKDVDHAARRIVMWIEAPGNALLGFADQINLDDEMSVLIEWLSRHRRYPGRRFLLVPGVDKMLQQLHGHYPMAVVSAREEMTTKSFLARFELTQYFDTIITGQSAKHNKPYPDPVLLAAQRMNVAPENCVMIGDTTVDIRAGKSAGAQTIGVLCGFGEEAELRKMGADEILPSTAQLTELLK